MFQRPYGQLYLVHPDGSALHRIPLRLASGAGALNPSWSPDGAWIVFSLQDADESGIFLVHPDGTGLRGVIGRARVLRRSTRIGDRPSSSRARGGAP